MKKSILVLIVLMTLKMTAQSFTEINEDAFIGVNYPSIAIANINAEFTDDSEIIITGTNNTGRVANIYTQDGNGNYYDATGVGNFIDAINSQSAVAFADIDNDGDQDLLITGYETKLYRNTGLGLYEEISTDIKDVTQGAVAFFDIDNDNDQDLLITGYHNGVNGTGDPATFLYVNDGNGNFTEDINSTLENFTNSTISVADIDGDNDLDLLLTGSVYSNDGYSKLYTNNGTGVFTEVVGTPFESVYEGVKQGSSAFADIDNDGDQDLFITGRNWQSQASGKLYTNNGSGVFTEVLNTGLPPVHESAIAFADVDNDNDLDLMITGLGNGPIIGKLYTNDGSGNFTEVADLPFDGFLRSAIAFFDADGDNDLDLIIAGFSIDANTYKTKLYENTSVLGTVDFEYLEKVNVYPNPATTTFTVKIPENLIITSSSLQFYLYDSLGRKVKKINHLSLENNTIDIQNLESGLYFYELINFNQKAGSGKVIIK